MANLCHCLRFPRFLSFLDFLERQVSLYFPNIQDSSGVPGLLLSRQVSLYLRPEVHLFAIIKNSTLRRDCNLLRQLYPFLTHLFDKLL